MEDSILKILLTSTVITTLITVIVKLIQGFQKDKINNITKERRAWREKIREIASNLDKGRNYYQIKNLLAELKVRLNAYGIKGGFTYNQDVHVWQVIERIEDDIGSFEKNKELLIKYLSLLLKYDWERSKKEVSISSMKLWMNILVFFIGIIMLSLNSTFKDNIEFLNMINCIYVICFILFIIIENIFENISGQIIKCLSGRKSYNDVIKYLDKQSRIDSILESFGKKLTPEYRDEIDCVKDYFRKLNEYDKGLISKTKEFLKYKKSTYFEHFMNEFIISYLEQNKNIKNEEKDITKLKLIVKIIQNFDEIKKIG